MFEPNGARTLSLLAAVTLPHVGDLLAKEPSSGELRVPVGRSDNDNSLRESMSGMVVLNRDITRDTTFRRGCGYVVSGEVRVRAGVTVTIEDGATILIRNGRISPRTIDTSALIFDSGSALRAGTVTFASADEDCRRVREANNGGVFFCGSYRRGTKDGVSSERRFERSDFRAERIILDHVGRADPREGDGNNNDRDDIDAVSVIGVGRREWNIKAIESRGSGDDGVDVYNSDISLDTLIITAPTEDGLNLTSSRLEIQCYCVIDTSKESGEDRELFDFEVDNGPARVVLAKNALVKLFGRWGNDVDDVRLRSAEMPKPPALGGPHARYGFTGTLTKPATIDSSRSD